MISTLNKLEHIPLMFFIKIATNNVIVEMITLSQDEFHLQADLENHL